MTGKTHQVIGVTVGLAVLLAQNPGYAPATCAAVLVVGSLGALLPDMDRPNGRLWGALPFGATAGELVNPFLAHRNLTHSLLGFGGFAAFAWWLLSLAPPYWGLHADIVLAAFLGAYASHLIADMVTVQGIPLLFPLPNMMGFPPRPFDGPRILTGRWFENLVVFPIADAALLALLIVQWGALRGILFQ